MLPSFLPIIVGLGYNLTALNIKKKDLIKIENKIVGANKESKKEGKKDGKQTEKQSNKQAKRIRYYRQTDRH